MSGFASLAVAAFVRPLYRHCVAQFPLACSACDRTYVSFLEYLLETDLVGIQRFDAIGGQSAAARLLKLSNCRCGSTLALSFDRRDESYSALLAAVRVDWRATGYGPDQILAALANAIRDHGMADPRSD
jgi:hypothetical protein